MWVMERLRAYLKTLSPPEQAKYAERSGTTIGYLRKALSVASRDESFKLGESIAIGLDRESGGEVPCESLRPDVDWGYLRRGGRISGLSTTSRKRA